MVLVSYFNTKSVVKPVNSLIESAEKIANGEEVEIAHLDKKKTQIKSLTRAEFEQISPQLLGSQEIQ